MLENQTSSQWSCQCVDCPFSYSNIDFYWVCCDVTAMLFLEWRVNQCCLNLVKINVSTERMKWWLMLKCKKNFTNIPNVHSQQYTKVLVFWLAKMTLSVMILWNFAPCCVLAIHHLHHSYLPLLHAHHSSLTLQLPPLAACLPFITYTTVTSPCCVLAILLLHHSYLPLLHTHYSCFYTTVTSPCCMLTIHVLHNSYLPLLRALHSSLTPQLPPLAVCSPFIHYTTVTSPCCMLTIHVLHHSYLNCCVRACHSSFTPQLPPLAACSPFIFNT